MKFLDMKITIRRADTYHPFADSSQNSQFWSYQEIPEAHFHNSISNDISNQRTVSLFYSQHSFAYSLLI